MTRVHGDLWLVTEDPTGVTQVVVRAHALRTRDGGLVTPLPKTEPVTDSKININLLPGPAYLTLISHGRQGESIPIVVPDAESATLESVMQAAEIADTTQRDVLEQIAAQITADREAVAADRQAVAQSKADVTGLAERAEQAAEDAETHAGLAEEKAGVASGAADDAGDSARVATQAATDTAADRTVVEQASARAVQAENAATGAATTATNKATEAGLAADRAVQATAGKADLIGGKVPTSQIPEVALTKPFPVSTRAEMLALDAQEGDIAIISTGPDKGSYILGAGTSTSFSSWLLMAVSADVPVQSVNGQVGNVNLGASDVGASPTGHTHTPASLGAAPASHTHTKLQISNLNESTGAVANSMALRDSGGRLTAATPTGDGHLTPKSYVDSRTPKIEVVSTLPSTLVAGTMYVVIV